MNEPYPVVCATCGESHDEDSQCPMAIAEREVVETEHPDDEQCRRCGADAELLGRGGFLLHFRCRRCGCEFGRPVDADPADIRDADQDR